MATQTEIPIDLSSIREFPADDFIPDSLDGFSIMIVGQRNSGKTLLTTELCYKLKSKRKWIDSYLFSQTAFCQENYYNFIPKSHRFDSLNMEKLKELLEQQKSMKDDLIRKKIKKVKRILIIFDDIIGDKDINIRNAPLVTQLFTTGRHYGIDMFILLQSAVGASPVQRKNTDVIFSFRATALNDRKRIVDDYLSLKNSRKDNTEAFELQKSIWEKEDYTTLAINRQECANAKQMSDFVYYYKASGNAKNLKFRVGDPMLFNDEPAEKISDEKNPAENSPFIVNLKKKVDMFSENNNSTEISGYNIPVVYEPRTGKFVKYKPELKTQLIMRGNVTKDSDNELISKTGFFDY